jgi:excinuclease UvrABC ATPase subunit
VLFLRLFHAFLEQRLGHAGGKVVATGTPEEIAACKSSHTGRFLKAHLQA